MFILLLFCFTACQAVGVADRNTIADARMTASTYYDSDHQPYYGPLNGKRGPNGAWCPKTTSDRSDYLQVDMGAVQSVCAVATEGTTLGHFVTNCKLRLTRVNLFPECQIVFGVQN